jgi:hypothetical protein
MATPEMPAAVVDAVIAMDTDATVHAADGDTADTADGATGITSTAVPVIDGIPVTVILAHTTDRTPCEHDLYCPRGQAPYCTQCETFDASRPASIYKIIMMGSISSASVLFS